MASGKVLFHRYIGIDYSGAGTAQSPQAGIRVYEARGNSAATEVRPQLLSKNARRHWSREDVFHWLAEILREPIRTIVGVDHAFSFPAQYFDRYQLTRSWNAFLADFCAHWPTDRMPVNELRRRGTGRSGEATWRRRTDVIAKAKSPFHFDVPGQVAPSTHAGLPWLAKLKHECGSHLWCWPFDGTDVPHDRSAIVEAYPALWKGMFPCKDATQDQRDAHTIARWLQQADRTGELHTCLNLAVSDSDRKAASFEGWIIGAERYEIPEASGKKAEKTRQIAAPVGPSIAEDGRMPEISRFFGIVIRMFYKEHGTPHFHADYGGSRASIDIESGAIRGELPPRALGLVLEWRAIHRAELLDAWQAARDQRPLPPIAPLE